MQTQRPRTITPHRLARLTAWLLALLVWFACGGGGPARHHRRYGHASIETLRAAVRAIILIHAASLLPKWVQRQPRNSTRSGMNWRHNPTTLHAVAGSWLRRRLYARGSFVTQVKLLLDALRQWRQLGAAIARRLPKRLTRLMKLIPARPPAAQLSACFAPALAAADTS